MPMILGIFDMCLNNITVRKRSDVSRMPSAQSLAKAQMYG